MSTLQFFMKKVMVQWKYLLLWVKAGGYIAGAAEVTGRLASLSLKYGAGLDEIADELVGISCGQKVGLGNGTSFEYV